MKSMAFSHSGTSKRSGNPAISRAVWQTLESRRLLSAVSLHSLPEGLKLADGGWLFVNSSGSVSETKADGSMDLSFGQGGTASVPGVTFGGQTADVPFSPQFGVEGSSVYVNPFALIADGDILVAGSKSGAAVVARFHADGTINSTFGDGGVASVQTGNLDPSFLALAVQSDGKIVAVGDSYIPNIPDSPIWQFTIARFNSDGSLDQSFNNGGVMTTALPGTKGFATGDQADAVAIQQDGRILVGGTSANLTGPTNPAMGFGLIRLNADGSLDTSFGDGGKVITYFKDAQPSMESVDRAHMDALFVRGDGTILAVGSGQSMLGFWGAASQVAAAVYNPDGSLDSNWGIGGRLLVDAASYHPETAQLTSDGGFEVFDRNSDKLALTIGPDGKSPDPNPVDPTPGSNDALPPPPLPPPAPVPQPLSFYLREGLKLANGGWLYVNSDDSVGEINADGSLNNSFGIDGIVSIPGVTFAGETTDVLGQTKNLLVNPFALADNGDILVAGGESGAAVVVALHADGTIDTSFGKDGLATAPLDIGVPSFFALEVQADGKIVAVGQSFAASSDQPIGQFLIARFNNSGKLDSTFNGSGVISMALPGGKGSIVAEKNGWPGPTLGDLADAVAIQKDGKILVGGSSEYTMDHAYPAQGFALIRLNTDGTLDTTFGAGGKVVTYYGAFDSQNVNAQYLSQAQIDSLLVRDDGTILAAGDDGKMGDEVAALYHADGTLDTNWGIGGRLLVYADTAASPENVQLTSDGGFEFLVRSGDEVAVTIGPDGRTGGNPLPFDPTPPASNGPVQTPDPGSTPTVEPPPPPGTVLVYGGSGGEVTAGNGAVISTAGTGTIPRDLALHSVHVHHGVQDELFYGKLAISVNASAGQSNPTYLVDWGDGSQDSSVTLTPDAKHPSRQTVRDVHQYNAPGVYKITVSLMYDSVTAETVTEKARISARSPNGRSLRAIAGKTINQKLGVILAQQVSGSANLFNSSTPVIVDWGDGSDGTTATTVKKRDGSIVVIASHVYQRPGAYVLTARFRLPIYTSALANDAVVSTPPPLFVTTIHVTAQ